MEIALKLILIIITKPLLQIVFVMMKKENVLIVKKDVILVMENAIVEIN